MNDPLLMRTTAGQIATITTVTRLFRVAEVGVVRLRERR